MSLQIFTVIVAIISAVASAPQVYEAAGVHHPTAKESEFSKAVTATLDSLPLLTAAFRTIRKNADGSFSSDPDSLSKVVSASLGIARESILSRAKSEGISPSQEDLEKLSAAESVMPVLSSFMAAMRDIGNDTDIPSSDQYVWSENTTGELQLDTEANESMVDVFVELLPDIMQVFEQISEDGLQSDPNDPEFLNRIILAFLPLSKKAVLTTAKHEGRVLSPKELNRLNRADILVPALIKFMKLARNIPVVTNSMSYGVTSNVLPKSNSADTPLNLPSTSETPAPATFKQPAFPAKSPLTNSRLETPKTPGASPSFPEITFDQTSISSVLYPTYYLYTIPYGK